MPQSYGSEHLYNRFKEVRSVQPFSSTTPQSLPSVCPLYLTHLRACQVRNRAQAKHFFGSHARENVGAAADAKSAAVPPNTHVSLFWCMFSMYWRRWAVGGLMYLVWCLSAAVQPLLVRRLVNFLEVGMFARPCASGQRASLAAVWRTLSFTPPLCVQDEEAPINEGIMYSVLLFLSAFIYVRAPLQGASPLLFRFRR